MPIKVKTLCFDLIHWSLILELTRSHGKWNGYPLQYSFLENSMDRGAWWTTVHVVTKSCTIKVTGTLLLLIQYNGARCHQWHVFNVIYIIITFKVCDGQGGLACCDLWGCKELDMTERLNWTESFENAGLLVRLHPLYTQKPHVSINWEDICTSNSRKLENVTVLSSCDELRVRQVCVWLADEIFKAT